MGYSTAGPSFAQSKLITFLDPYGEGCAFGGFQDGCGDVVICTRRPGGVSMAATMRLERSAAQTDGRRSERGHKQRMVENPREPARSTRTKPHFARESWNKRCRDRGGPVRRNGGEGPIVVGGVWEWFGGDGRGHHGTSMYGMDHRANMKHISNVQSEIGVSGALI